MEDNRKLVRMFDRVKLLREREEAMLADLLTDKKEDLDMNQNRIRRIPAAALAAAVLVIALAGTALAVEYFGKVRIGLINFSGNSDDLTGYTAYMPEGYIRSEDLSDEILAACPDVSAANGSWLIQLPFDSWSEAEVFLGLELADNSKLEQMPPKKLEYYPDGHNKALSPCVMSVNYCPERRRPSHIGLHTCYQEANCHVRELVSIAVDSAGEGGTSVPFCGDTAFQEYVTPSGLEVTIYSEVVTRTYGGGSYDDTSHVAHFIKNNALFTVRVSTTEAWKIGREGQEFLDPWDMLIEILDAYE